MSIALYIIPSILVKRINRKTRVADYALIYMLITLSICNIIALKKEKKGCVLMASLEESGILFAAAQRHDRDSAIMEALER